MGARNRASRLFAAAIFGVTGAGLVLVSACYTAPEDEASTAKKRTPAGSTIFVPAEAPTMPPIPPGAGPPAPGPDPDPDPDPTPDASTDAKPDTGGGGQDSGSTPADSGGD